MKVATAGPPKAGTVSRLWCLLNIPLPKGPGLRGLGPTRCYWELIGALKGAGLAGGLQITGVPLKGMVGPQSLLLPLTSWL